MHRATLGGSWTYISAFNIAFTNNALVRLPSHLSGSENEKKTSTDAKRIQDYFYSSKVEVPVKCVNGVLYVRVSCHLYNTAEDFEKLAQAALKMS